MQDRFRAFANAIADQVGSPWMFSAGLLLLLLWAAAGPFLHYSDTWQLLINTGTNIVTFLIVFLIQNSQNRNAQAMQLKLNEIIRAMGSARNQMLDLENCSDEEIAAIREEFRKIRERSARNRNPDGNADLTPAG
ncbi:MAG TPA: low affinity iron permease family protein [Bryobacteraceae bacterium]|jgi:low affinity Fe/Cu permease|nr:low affinity iron permease family protein [Bryobacteraceae bacterium]